MVIKDSLINVREGFEDIIFMDATHFDRILLENVTVEGYRNPTVIIRSQGEVENINSTPLTILHSDEPAHFERL